MSMLLTGHSIENGMTMYKEPSNRIHTCPHCGAEWEDFIDRDPIGIGTVWYEHDCALTRSYPIGRGFCRACALESASMEDMVAYIREKELLWSFFASLLKSDVMDKLNHRDILSVWDAAFKSNHDMLEQRVREYIEDEKEDDFIAWRCEE